VIDIQFDGARPAPGSFGQWVMNVSTLADHLSGGGNVASSWSPAVRPVTGGAGPCQPHETVRTLAAGASITEPFLWDLGLPSELLNRGDISSNPIGNASLTVYGRPEIDAPAFIARQEFAELILTDADVSANPLDTAIATVAGNATVAAQLHDQLGWVGVEYKRGNWWFTFSTASGSNTVSRRLIVRFTGNQISDIRWNDPVLGPNDDPGAIGTDPTESIVFHSP